MKRPASWVVKLGGSLALSPQLPHWLHALSKTQAIIVPGGGPFADNVRLAQNRWIFDDRTAHHMAILAMQQYGLMLAGLNPTLKTLKTGNLQDFPSEARIWLPDGGELDEAGVPASWAVTSDSLAAWLAAQIGAENLLLVKSLPQSIIDAERKPLTLERVVKLGWVDEVFAEYARLGGFRSWLCGPEVMQDLQRGLEAGSDCLASFTAISYTI